MAGHAAAAADGDVEAEDVAGAVEDGDEADVVLLTTIEGD